MRSLFLITFILFLSSVAFAQTPVPLLQKAFESDIGGMYISPDQKHFITVENATASDRVIKLWDYKSRVIIKEHYVNLGNGEGTGKVRLDNRGIVYITDNQKIKEIDLFNTQISTDIFKVEWPEYIADFVKTSNKQMVISTKVLDEKAGTVYDVTNKARLYTYDLNSNVLIAQKEFAFQITSLTNHPFKNEIILGNNFGAIQFYNPSSFEKIRPDRELYKKNAIREIIVASENQLVINAAQGKNSKTFNLNHGIGSVMIIDIENTDFEKVISFEDQIPPKHPDMDDFIYEKFIPSNGVKQLLPFTNSRILILYAFNKIADLDLSSYNVEDVSPYEFDYKIEAITSHPATSELIISYGMLNPIGGARDLATYSSNKRRVLFNFNELQRTIDAKIILPVGDQLLFADFKNSNYGNESKLNLHSMYSGRVNHIEFKSATIAFTDNLSHWIIKSGKRVFIGKPKKRLLKYEKQVIEFSYDDEGVLKLSHQEWFENYSYFEFSQLPKSIYINDLVDFIPEKQQFIASVRKNNEIQYALINADGSIEGTYDYGTKFKLSPDGKYLAIVKKDFKSTHISLNTVTDLKEVFSISYKRAFSPDPSFDSSSNYLYYKDLTMLDDVNIEFSLTEYNISTREKNVLHNGDFYRNHFVDRKNNWIYYIDHSSAKKINYNTGAILYDRPASFARQPTTYLHHFDKVALYNTNFVTLFDASSNEFMETYFFENDQKINITDKNYYQVSANLKLENFGFSIDEKGYSFAQFDQLYNRPDLVMQFLEFPEIFLIETYELAYKKRMSRLGFKPSTLKIVKNIPVAQISTNEPSLTTSSDQFLIDLNFSDTALDLKSYNIWVNGVPIYGSVGKDIKDSVTRFRESVMLTLSSGSNKIEVSCTNTAGLESLRESMQVYNEVVPEKPKLYLIGIGVSNYEDSSFNLEYATKDVKDMERHFKETSSDYDSVQSVSLLDENVSLESVMALKKLLQLSHVDDHVIVFYAGHGLLDDQFDYYLSTYDMNFEQPAQNGIPYSTINDLLDGIPARKKLILIDACHSGEVDKDALVTIENDRVDHNLKLGYRGAGSDRIVSKSVDQKKAFELMQDIYTDLRVGSGSVTISSSSGLEYAYESEEWNNGVFTFALLDGLKSNTIDINEDGEIKISEIKDYVSKKVYDLTDGLQKPNSRSINAILDWSLMQ